MVNPEQLPWINFGELTAQFMPLQRAQINFMSAEISITSALTTGVAV